MLDINTQKRVLNIISEDFSRITTLKNKGLALSDDFFTGDNKEKFKGIIKAEKMGYSRLTNEFAEKLAKEGVEIEISNMFTEDDLIDVTINLRKQIEDEYTKEADKMMKEAMSFYKNSEDKKKGKEKVEKALKLFRTTQFQFKSRTLSEIIKDKMKYQENKERIPSYLEELDNDVLKGGFPRSGAHIIAGFPGSGKTAAAVQFASLQAMYGYKVLFLSLEQPEQKILSNILSVAAREEKHNREFWDISKLTEGNAIEREVMALELVEELIEENLEIDDTRHNNQDDLIERIRHAALVEKYDVIYMDNFQNAPQRPGMNAEASYSYLAEKIMDIILDSNAIIFYLSQLTMRDGQAHPKYSNKINENAITNLIIERIEPGDDEDDPDTKVKVSIFSEKAREGIQDVTKIFHFNGAKSIIGSFQIPYSTLKDPGMKKLREEYPLG